MDVIDEAHAAKPARFGVAADAATQTNPDNNWPYPRRRIHHLTEAQR